MSERKPPGMRFEDFTERQIREALERGEFDGLPGAGKPIAGLDRPFTAESWVAGLIEREGGDIGVLLPPLLLLRRERAALLAALAEVPREQALREIVEDFNRRLLQEYRRPMDGPLIAVGVLDVEETVDLWRQARPPEEDVSVVIPVAPRRWWRARRRR